MQGRGPPTEEEVRQRRLAAEAGRAGESVDSTAAKMIDIGLSAASAKRKQIADAEALRADILLVTATQTEHDELRTAAEANDLPFEKRQGRLRPYYHLGTIGTNRVAHMQVEMGPFGVNGSAARCIEARAETRATTIILLGTAFGIDPDGQNLHEVLVSESVFLYEDRHVVDLPTRGVRQHAAAACAQLFDLAGAGRSRAHDWLSVEARPSYLINYPAARRRASAGWVSRFRQLADNAVEGSERISVGTILSGGSRIESLRYKAELLRSIPELDTRIIGGEMEAVGVVSASPSARYEDPGWIVVKGIADFGDAATRAQIAQNRGPAAAAAARVVLRALQSATPP